MIKISEAFVSILLISNMALAQSAQSVTQQPATRSQSGAAPLTSQQTTDLAEAKRLSAEVVKLYNQQKYDEALPLAKAALGIRERVLGADGPLVAAAMVNLAELYIAKRKYGEALAMYQRVLPIYEKAFGPVNDQTAIIVDSLAFLSYIKGDFDEAERFYQRALSSRELAGSERREVAQALYKLAEFYRSRREFKKAEPLFLRAIAINDKLDTQNDPDAYKTILRYVCFLYESRSTNEEAQKAEREFFEGRKTKTPLEPSSSLSGGVVNGRAISLPRPAFPDEARQLRATGIVRVQVLIDETGKVIEAKVLTVRPSGLWQASSGIGL